MPKQNKKKQAATEEVEDQDEDEEPEEEEVEEEEEEEPEDEEVDEEAEEEEEEEEEEKPAKKGKKGAKKGNLVPRTPVAVPKDVLKNSDKEIRSLLKQRDEAIAKGDKAAQRKIRMALRKKGFRLSELGK